MRYAGFDVSKTCTGWGLITPEKESSGAFRCNILRPFELPTGRLSAAYAGNVGQWYCEILDAWLVKHKPDVAGIEQPQPGNLQRTEVEVVHDAMFAGQALRKVKKGGTNFETTHFLIGLAFGFATVCRRRNIEPIYVPSNTWRKTNGILQPPKSVDPKNKSSWYKDQARRVCSENEHKPTSGDAAEAYCIALHLKKLDQPRNDLFARAS